MKVTVLMNNGIGLPVARKFNLQMLRTGQAYQNGPDELVIQGKYKGKRKISAFRKSVDRVVIIEGWHEPKSAFNNKGEGTQSFDCFQNDSVDQMLKECNGVRVLMEYKDRAIEKMEEMQGVKIDCDALMLRVQTEVEIVNNASS